MNGKVNANLLIKNSGTNYIHIRPPIFDSHGHLRDSIDSLEWTFSERVLQVKDYNKLEASWIFFGGGEESIIQYISSYACF